MCFLKWKKEKILNWTRKGKKTHAETAEVYDKKPSIHEIVKKDKEICAGLAVVPQTANVTVTVLNKCLVKMKKALHLYNDILTERENHIHTAFITICCSILLFIVINLFTVPNL